MKKHIYVAALIINFIISASISGYYFHNKDYSNYQVDKQKNLNLVTTEKDEKKNEEKNEEIKDRPLLPKEVFLTFDDGPSINTIKILKILNNYNVKATFFVIGSNVDIYPDVVKAEYTSGMSIVNHSYTHQYSMYKSVESCMADFDKCDSSIKKITGVEPLKFIRFPGGSDNTVSNSNTMKIIRNTVVSKGIDYVDWNASSEDSESRMVLARTIENNLLGQLSSTNFAVILMHDAPAKTTTVQALPTVIDYLKKQGFEFRTFNDLTPTEKKEMKKRRIINRAADK